MDTVIPSDYVTVKSEKPNAAAVGGKKKLQQDWLLDCDFVQKSQYIQIWWEY